MKKAGPDEYVKTHIDMVTTFIHEHGINQSVDFLVDECSLIGIATAGALSSSIENLFLNLALHPHVQNKIR